MPKRFFRIAILLPSVILAAAIAAAQVPYTSWRQYIGSADSSNYTALNQITKSNVTKLEVAWKYATGDNIMYSFSPIVVDRTMYGVAKSGALVAVDATNGKELWVQDFTSTGPAQASRGRGAGISGQRGLSYWESPDRSDRRLLVKASGFMMALDARTGKLVDSFGDHGRFDLKEGVPRATAGVTNGTPGRVFENLIIIGSAGGGYAGPPGDIRAVDVRTGKLAWVFHTVPLPGEFGYDTWPKDSWRFSPGAHNWGEMSVDGKRGIVYIPLDNPGYDFYGGDRPGDNLFGNCLLALDARTGKRLWHFQTVHHDVWDYDLTSAPQLLTAKQNGRNVDIVAQAGKTGFLYVFDRVTGQPIWPIEERAVPQTDAPGEFTSPTQPFPTKPPPFARQKFTADDINPMMPKEYISKFKDFIFSARNEGIFTPPTKDRYAVQMPGHSGGSGTFSTSADPVTGTMFIQSFDGPAFLKLEKSLSGGSPNEWYGPVVANYGAGNVEKVTWMDFPFGGSPRASANAAAAAAGADAEGGGGRDAAIVYPPGVKPPIDQPYYSQFGWAPAAIKPPWSTVTAYDLNTGVIKWQIPYGEAVGADPPGNDYGIPQIHGAKARLVVTGGGLLFSATAENKIRAYDKDTGKILWTAPIPDRAQGSPVSYEVDGRQYVVVGNRGWYVAFALPAGTK